MTENRTAGRHRIKGGITMVIEAIRLKLVLLLMEKHHSKIMKQTASVFACLIRVTLPSN